MNKAVSLYGLLGLFAGAIFSSCICGTPKNSKGENDCSLMGKIETSLVSTIPKTIYNGFVILAIELMHYLISRGYKSAAPYTMILPFWVAFTLSVSYMSE
ncbi:hypothetical protein D0Y65_028410 [Glycine soja]|uniref:Uncharacterized protein n=1 Tax=Glycine soja TaxID=3848 RepID=A0A445IU93_GLYSO|nr:hypothetical protein JHK87_029413 [Glycine soja]KHN37370.1 hypothetical protein glysoja_013585 [Glycine soja]RZB89600.1 hypothetical protein D0Y65_028410 [Glycine soja]